MKTKLEMAHEWYMKYSESPSFMNTEVEMAWDYADAMQAEADKRTKKCDEKIEINMYPEWDATINYPPDAWVVYRGEKRLAVSIKDKWQPDWSQAPEWANWWVIGSLTKQGIWSEAKPNSVKINGVDYWEVTSPSGDEHLSVSPSFNYQGDWRNSLRKRPE